MTTLLMPLLLIAQILLRSPTASHLVLLNPCKSSSSSFCVGWWVPLPGRGVSLSTCPMVFISYVYSFLPLPFVISLNPPEFGEGEINECSAG